MLQVFRPVSWQEVRRLADQLSPFWVFRGHRNASWRLTTTLERSAQTWPWYVEKRERERAFLWHFQTRAHQYLHNSPPLDHHVDWLSLLQHFGGPTRLLDFTESFYVAVFFAIDGAYADLRCGLSNWMV